MKSIKNFMIKALIFQAFVLFLFSCKMENSEPKKSSESSLPQSFMNRWYSDSVDKVVYTISEDEIRYNGQMYDYASLEPLVLANNVYQVQANSSEDDQFFYMKDGDNSNEIFISTSNPGSAFDRYCLNSFICQVGVDSTFIGEWYNLDGDEAYILDSDEQDRNFINSRLNEDVNFFFREENAVMYDEDYFKIISYQQGETNIIAYTYYLQQDEGRNSILISEADSTTFQRFYRYTGRTITYADYDGGHFEKSLGSTTWEDEKDGNAQNPDFYTEISRTDWSVFLQKNDGGGIIELDVENMNVYFTPTAGTEEKLYDITSVEN